MEGKAAIYRPYAYEAFRERRRLIWKCKTLPLTGRQPCFRRSGQAIITPIRLTFHKAIQSFTAIVTRLLGKSLSSDYSAVIVIAYNRKSGIFYVEQADIKRRHPDCILSDILECALRIRRYGKKFISFGAETNQFQWFKGAACKGERKTKNISANMRGSLKQR